jgi:hypothetical protein
MQKSLIKSRAKRRVASSFRALSFVTALICGTPVAQAINLQVTNDYHIVLTGFIERNDDAKFSVFLESLPERFHGPRLTIELSGPGGLMQTAMLIGFIIRQRGYDTMIKPRQSCNSACALIWLAGVNRLADKSSIVGFHRPDGPLSRWLPSTEYSKPIEAYLTLLKYPYPQRTVDFIMKADPSTITRLTPAQMGISGIFYNETLRD